MSRRRPYSVPWPPGFVLRTNLWTLWWRSSRTKRDVLAKGLREVGFPVTGAEGTYFLTVDISKLTDEDAATFCRELPHRCGVVAVPCLCSTAIPRPDAIGCVSLSASVALR